MIRSVTFALSVFAASAAFAQQGGSVSESTSTGSKTMRQLLSEGYEIKASVPNGTKFIVFMQKEKSAYACEFVTVTNARCGSIN